MKFKKTTLILAISAAALAGCADTPTGSRSIEDAARHLDEGNIARSQAICDSLMADSSRLADLSVGQLCTLANMFLRLDSALHAAPETVADANDAMAARCLSRARAIDPDSVEAFIGSLPREAAARMAVINRVSTYLDIPRDSLAIEEPTPDSL